MDTPVSTVLSSTVRKVIPFYDVDAIHMVYHGNYVKYLEDGREDFFKKYGLSYLSLFDQGYVIPVVELNLQYKKVAEYGDTLLIETTYVPNKAAKWQFTYRITRESDGALILTAQSTQLFVRNDGEFELSTPDFVRAWRKKWNV